jgi:hypothetical protein
MLLGFLRLRLAWARSYARWAVLSRFEERGENGGENVKEVGEGAGGAGALDCSGRKRAPVNNSVTFGGAVVTGFIKAGTFKMYALGNAKTSTLCPFARLPIRSNLCVSGAYRSSPVLGRKSYMRAVLAFENELTASIFNST